MHAHATTAARGDDMAEVLAAASVLVLTRARACAAQPAAPRAAPACAPCAIAAPDTDVTSLQVRAQPGRAAVAGGGARAPNWALVRFR